MTKEEYLNTQMAIIQVGRLVNQIDLETFAERLETAKAIPADPKAEESLQAIKDLVQSLLPVKKAYENVFNKVINIRVAEFKGKDAKVPNP